MKSGTTWKALILILVLTFTGCGGGGGSPSPNPGNTNNGDGNTGGNNGGSTPTPTCSLPEAAISLTKPNDPLQVDQWHLINSTNTADINIEPLWENAPAAGFKGEGVVIAVVDDGVEIAHPDLVANTLDLCHRDFRVSSNTQNQDPTPTNAEDAHGTAVAGIIAARDNDIGVTGVAPRASLLGINLLDTDRHAGSAGILVSEIAAAMTHQRAIVAVSNNSWGASDTGFLNSAHSNWKSAIESGISASANAIRGRGITYLFAAGNGHHIEQPSNIYFQDFSGMDEKTGHHGVLTIAAANADDTHASYSEWGSNLLVSAYGGNYCTSSPAITTTDLTGSDRGLRVAVTDWAASDYPDQTDYTRCFNGTSAATPMVAGIVALMYQANPNLTWRDVRWLLARTARQIDPANDWVASTNGYPYNLRYGFGVVDATAAVGAAKTHSQLKSYQSLKRTLPNISSMDTTVPAADTVEGTKVLTYDLSSDITLPLFIDRLEHITVNIGLEAANTADKDNFDTGMVQIWLLGPDSTPSLLMPFRSCEATGRICEPSIPSSFDFGNVQFMGEAPSGTWKLAIENLNPYPAKITHWSLTFRGHKE